MKGTKQNIIEAAIQLIGEDKNCSLEQIALKANVSRRTLHRYFKGKDDLTVQVFEVLAHKYVEDSLTIFRKGNSAFETLKEIFEYEFETVFNHETLYYLYLKFPSKFKTADQKLDNILVEYS